jgi:hypothetical protein
MSVAESFSLFPLSKYFVTKSTEPSPNPNVGVTQPIASGLIENDGVNITGGVTGNYTWHRLSHFGGTANTQGAELREYLLVCRNVSTTSNNASFSLAIPDGGFNPNYMVFKALYKSMSVTNSDAPGSNTWSFTVTGANFDYVQISTSTTFSPNGQSFFCLYHGNLSFNWIEGDPSIHVHHMHTLNSSITWINLLPQLEVMQRFVVKYWEWISRHLESF